MSEYSAYVGLDVHKDTIAVAVALPGRDEPVYRGEVKNQRKSLLRVMRSLSPHGEVVSFCYEAGPCGYGVYREIIETGHHCDVVAPSLIPRRAGERVKTDRRDAVKLARLHRSGELTAVWVPDDERTNRVFDWASSGASRLYRSLSASMVPSGSERLPATGMRKPAQVWTGSAGIPRVLTPERSAGTPSSGRSGSNRLVTAIRAS